MGYIIDKESGASVYMQLYTALRKDITSGVYRYGAKLPSKRQVALETGVSVIPVAHAYDILCDEGYAEGRERSGYYVIYRESDLLTPEHPPRRASVSAVPEQNRDEFPFSALSRVMRRVLTEYGERILAVSPRSGLDELRGAISEYLRRSRSIEADPSQIIIGSGSEYLYSLTAQLLRDAGVFALEDPSYAKIERVYRANGIMCERLRLESDGIASDELRSSKAGVLHVTPFNSYPSGVTASASKRREYVRWSRERSGYVIEDDFDSEFSPLTKREDTLFSLGRGERVIYMNTFSRTISPSIRVGYMVLPSDLAAMFGERLGFYSCTVPVYEQLVLTELIDSGEFERHINRIRRRRRDRLR